VRFSGGDCDKKYHVTLDFTQQLLDKNNAVVPMTDCRKMYMVFAPRFENVEQDLEDGCFLTVGVGAADSVWAVDERGSRAPARRGFAAADPGGAGASRTRPPRPGRRGPG
jgi:hypothetical protein